MKTASSPIVDAAGGSLPSAATPRFEEPQLRLSGGYILYALAILLVIQTLANVDRQIISIVAEPIKDDFGLKDWQLGALSGSAFAVFYTTLSIPVARLAERTNRPHVIGAAAFIWSIFTMLAAATTTFPMLFLTRIGVGVGEAGSIPAGHSLVTSYVTKERRAAALAVFSAGLPMGVLVGMAIGGIFSDVYGWRSAFLVAGAPGIVFALVAAFTLVEPRRSLKEKRPPIPTIVQALSELARKRSLILITVAATFWAFTHNAIGAFTAAFFIRTHQTQLAALAHQWGGYFGVDLGAIGFLGLALGVSGGVFGVIGTFLGGWLTDKLIRHDKGAYVSVLAVSRLIGIPIALAPFLIDNVGLGLWLLAIGNMLNALGTGGLYAAIQSLVRPDMRATASASFGLIVNIISIALGPLCAGLLSDGLASRLGPIEGLRWSLIVMHILSLFCVAAYWSARRPLIREMES